MTQALESPFPKLIGIADPRAGVSHNLSCQLGADLVVSARLSVRVLQHYPFPNLIEDLLQDMELIRVVGFRNEPLRTHGLLLPRAFRASRKQNQLLAALTAEDFASVEPHLVPVKLDLRQVLEPANKRIKYSYFLESGLASVIAQGKNGHRLEVDIIGREGMTGLPIVTGNDRSPNETFIQVQGNGSRIASEDLRDAIQKSRTLHAALLNFVYAFMIQTAHTALSNGTASLEQRLARWLLMAQDRAGGDEVPLTHEFLSLMLGVRRAGVTVSLNQLERKGFIRLQRGRIQVADRRGLIKAADGSYGIPEAAAKRGSSFSPLWGPAKVNN